MDPDLSGLPESLLVALREELRHLLPGQLSEEFVANMAGTRERLEAFFRHGSSEILEDGVADAGNRLSAAIMRAAFDSLDDGSPCFMHDGETYRREDVSRKRVMTSFGAIEHDRPRCRRKRRPSLFPVGRRAGLTESFRTPRAARIALHRLALPPPRERVRTFLQQGGTCPSVASPVRLREAAGRRWEEIAPDALARIRDQEEVPDAAAVASIQIDGVMVPMLAETHASKGEGGVEWRETACATISLGTAEGELLRTIRHGRMPERDKRRLKELVVEEVDALLAKRPDLRLVTIANGAHGNCKSQMRSHQRWAASGAVLTLIGEIQARRHCPERTGNLVLVPGAAFSALQALAKLCAGAFDAVADPEEMSGLAPDPGHSEIPAELENELRAICDPEAVGAQAFVDQDALVARHGGREAALGPGAPGATPPPDDG